MTRKEFVNVFSSFPPEDKLFIAKQIHTHMGDAEELADIAAYKKAKQKLGKSVPFDEAFRKVEAHHDKQAS